MEAGIIRTINGIPTWKALEQAGLGAHSCLGKGSVQQPEPAPCPWAGSEGCARGSCSHGLALRMFHPVPKHFPELALRRGCSWALLCARAPGLLGARRPGKVPLWVPVGTVSVIAEGSLLFSVQPNTEPILCLHSLNLNPFCKWEILFWTW